MDPELGGSLIKAGAGLVGGLMSGLFGKSSQDSANETNIMLTRETNAMNRELYYDAAERQDKWNERQYEEYWKQREYDSLKNQMARYRAIGINPYFALGNVQGGQAAGSTPTPSSQLTTPQMSTPEVRAYDPTQAIMGASQQVGDSVSSYFDNSLKEESVRQLAIKNITQLDRDLAELDNMIADKNKKEEDTKMLREQREQLVAMRSDIIKSAKLRNLNVQADTNKKRAESDYVSSQTEFQDMHNTVFKNTQWYTAEKIMRELDEMMSRINLNRASAGDALAHRFVNLATSNGIRIDNFQKNKINWMVRNALKLDIRLKQQDLGIDGNWYSGKYNPLRDGFQTMLTGVADGAKAAATRGRSKSVGVMR